MMMQVRKCLVDERTRRALLVTVQVLAVVCLFSAVAAAGSSTGGGSMPWEGPLQTIANSLKGPVAYSIGIIAFAVAGASMAFSGGDMNQSGRTLVGVCFAVAIVIGGAKILDTIQGAVW